MHIQTILLPMLLVFCVACAPTGQPNEHPTIDSTQSQTEDDSIIVATTDGTNTAEDTVTFNTYFAQLDRLLHPEGGITSGIGKYFGKFETDHFLLDENSINPNISDYKKIGSYHLLTYSDGDDCERSYHYLLVDNRFGLLDTLSFYVGGCENESPNEEIFAPNSDDIFKKDTIDEFCYYAQENDPNIKVDGDTLRHIVITSYTIKDTLTRQYYYTQFAKKRIFVIDTLGHFRLEREETDPFSTQKLLNRILK